MDKRIDGLRAWVRRENERPLVGFFIDSQYPLHRYRCIDKLPAGEVHADGIRVSDFLPEFERLYQTYEAYGGDLIWSSAPFWGIPWIEASLGCHVLADHRAGSTRSLPPDGFLDNPEIPDFNPDNPWVKKMIEFIPSLHAMSGGRFPVGMTLLRGISDLLSALYGGERFIVRMLEAPEEVKAVIRQLEQYWISFGKHLLDQLPGFHGGTGSFFYAVWTPGKTIWFQEDAAALLSPGLYEEFIFPSVKEIIEAFDRSVIHLHPSRFIPAGHLLETDIDAIELHRDIGGPTAKDLHGTHHMILEKKPLIIWGDLTGEDLDVILSELPAKGLLVIPVVKDKVEAKKIWDRFKTDNCIEFSPGPRPRWPASRNTLPL